jgi:hypothetical protein
MRTFRARTRGLACSIIARRRHCKENKHTEEDLAGFRNKSSDDQLHTRQPKVRVITLEHFPPPTADTHIYICMLANTMHVWLAKQPLINKGLRQWLPSGVRNSSQRFSLTPSLSLSPSLVCLPACLSVCRSICLSSRHGKWSKADWHRARSGARTSSDMQV